MHHKMQLERGRYIGKGALRCAAVGEAGRGVFELGELGGQDVDLLADDE